MRIREPGFEGLERGVLLRDAAGQRRILIADDLIGAEQRLKTRHFGGDRRERKRGKIGSVRDHGDVRVAGRRRNAVELADLAIGPCDVGCQALVDVALVDKQELVPLLGVETAVAVARLRLAEHFRRSSGAHAANLVLQGDEGTALIAEGLDLVAELLGRLAEPRVAGDLRLGALDDELGAIGCVIRDQLLLLPDLGGQRSDKAFFLKLSGDALRDVGDRLGFALARLLEPRDLLVAQLGEIQRPFAIVLGMRLEDHALDLVNQAVGDALGRAKLLDELLGEIPGARKGHMAVGVAAIQGARDRRAPAPG